MPTADIGGRRINAGQSACADAAAAIVVTGVSASTAATREASQCASASENVP